ncbi:MAG: ABC transporter substrate-binding protein [Proteobacteria bacterium]|nr:ABC transporter substrate-binding protein [Pseudomonadota bacterium]
MTAMRGDAAWPRMILVALVGLTPLALPAQTAPVARPAAAVPGPGPQELMQKAAQDMLRELDANRAAITKDPTRLRGLADKYLLPHFDVDYAARLVLGKHWRTATEAQRKRFIDAFYQSLMRNYGDAVAEFTADRLKIQPFKGDLTSGAATVRTEVKRSNGTPVPVNYSMRATPQGWKAWDVTIEGISYVKNYRTDFGAEIDQKGLDAVIERLEAQNQRPASRMRRGRLQRPRPVAESAAAGNSFDMDQFSIQRVAEGRLEASGVLGYVTAGRALPAGLALIPKGSTCTIDLSRVTEADSAGLAVLVEWLATAKSRGTVIRYECIPAQILAVARISEAGGCAASPSSAAGSSLSLSASSAQSASSPDSLPCGGLPSKTRYNRRCR